MHVGTAVFDASKPAGRLTTVLRRSLVIRFSLSVVGEFEFRDPVGVSTGPTTRGGEVKRAREDFEGTQLRVSGDGPGRRQREQDGKAARDHREPHASAVVAALHLAPPCLSAGSLCFLGFFLRLRLLLDALGMTQLLAHGTFHGLFLDRGRGFGRLEGRGAGGAVESEARRRLVVRRAGGRRAGIAFAFHRPGRQRRFATIDTSVVDVDRAVVVVGPELRTRREEHIATVISATQQQRPGHRCRRRRSARYSPAGARTHRRRHGATHTHRSRSL